MPDKSSATYIHPAALAVLGPPGLLAAVAVLMLAAPLVGRHPLWPSDRLTMSEAVAMRDLGALTELLSSGQNPHKRYEVRAEVARMQPMTLTPFEAAVATRRDDVIRFLRERGIEPTADERLELICLARREKAPELQALLEAPGVTTDCEHIKYPW